ncbi:MAG: hypothetical protein ACI4D3_11875 [Lachnospiraceae bacterium]
MRIVDVIQQDNLFPNSENSHKHKEKILYAMVAPILFGLLVGLKSEVVESCHGIDKILLRELARNYREGDGDCGICFEYAVHSAIRNNNPLVIERIQSALSMCGIEGKNTTSILLGFEKSKLLQINNELLNTLTENSILLSEPYGERIKIKKYLERIQKSFRFYNTRNNLPVRINGIWKADLFVGNTDTDMWAAASVKINPLALRYAKGLAIGIVPSRWEQEKPCQVKNGMIICPLLYENNFMNYFYSAWRIVYFFIKNDAKIPHERFLAGIEELRVAKYLEQKRDVPVLELVDDDLKRLAHPTLLSAKSKQIVTTDIYNNFSDQEDTNSTIIVPDPILRPVF